MNNVYRETLAKQEREFYIHKIQEKASQFEKENGRKPIIMEVCGSHTVALAKLGLKQRLQDCVRFISGPGCPVCVTDQSTIDYMIHIADKNEDTIVCTFGDMMRVPGSNGSLADKKAEGRDIRVIYSPLEIIPIAMENKDKEVVMLGIGFETTIPSILAAVKQAKDKNLTNVKVFLSAKRIEPILQKLLHDPDLKIDGFLLPGHVAMILGEDYFSFLEDYNIPGIISGFQLDEMITSVYEFIKQLCEGKGKVYNNYPSIVSKAGNIHAQALLDEMLEPCDEVWRGLGLIESSGYRFREKYKSFGKELDSSLNIKVKKTACRCGEILVGKIEAEQCPLFAKACTPVNPIGPCMVSHEGSCAAAYQYNM